MLLYFAATVLSLSVALVSGSRLGSLFQSPEHQKALSIANASLSGLSESSFTVFSHPHFPSHSIRIKRVSQNWCDPSVNKYTGYITTPSARNFFFYFFESRSDPSVDDVIMWINGGPGSSASFGLFMELGPCTIENATSVKVNPYSWNSNANVFFLDQPVGTGFSYSDYGESVSTSEEAAKDLVAFLYTFFETFSQFNGRPLHLAGESYAGRELPVFAAEIFEQNKASQALGKNTINLQSIMLGNGYTSEYLLIPSYYDALCTPAIAEPSLDIQSCVRIKTALPRCEKWLKNSCIDIYDQISCRAARDFCEAIIGLGMLPPDLNPYDLSVKCDGGYADTMCYPESKDLTEYLNGPSIRSLLGVSDSVPNKTSDTNLSIFLAFRDSNDALKDQTLFYVEALLDRGVDVLVYVGANDMICNWIGIEKMVNSLEWRRSDQFKRLEWKPWYARESDEIQGNRIQAGTVKNVDGLTFLRIDGAGHLAPHDKPLELLDMVNKWLKKRKVL